MSYNAASIQWYHGKVNRDVATQKLLQRGQKDGIYLIRDCRISPSDFVLSLVFRNQVMHFQIHCLGDNRFVIDDGPVFQGLDSLVAHYKVNPDGLPCKLTEFAAGKLAPLHALKFGVDTKLHIATGDGSSSNVKLLLNAAVHRSNINARDSKGCTALHLACAKGHNEIVEILLNAGADTAVSDGMGKTPVQVCCVNNHASTLRLLIQKDKADFHERCPMNGWVPLHEVAMRGFLDCVKVLLSFNASMYPRTLDGDTPRDLALRHGNQDIVDYFESYPVPSPRTSPSQWLHDNLDREGTLTLLKNAGQADGCFLVRTSTKCHGYYVLSSCLDKKVYHYQIKSRADRWFYIDDGPLFETVPHLVDHYMQYADGLPSILTHPVASPKKHAPLPPPPMINKQLKLPVPPKQPSNDGDSDSFARLEQIQNEKSKLPRPPANLPTPPPPMYQPPSGIGVQPVPTHPPSALHPSKRPSPPSSNGAVSPSNKPSPTNKSKPFSQTMIKHESLTLGSELGVGEFGSVLRGVWRDNDGNEVNVALKTLHKDKLHQGEKEFLREARVMSQLDHSCIVRLIGVCLGPPMILVQELVAMGALLDYLIDFQPEIRELDLKLWAAQVAWGMMYLEQKRFVHRDLATRNILLANKNQVKISDFGLSRAVGTGSNYYQAQQGGRWPVKWYSPESINFGTFSQKSDIWSYGVTLWEMFTFGELPYGEMTGPQVIAYLEQGGRLEQPEDCPVHTYQIMLNCWHIEPAKRPTFKELHNVFSTDPEYQDARKYRDNLKK